MGKRKTYSFKEIADQLGVTEEDIMTKLKDGGYIDSEGMPTELAISEGILIIEPEGWFTNN